MVFMPRLGKNNKRLIDSRPDNRNRGDYPLFTDCDKLNFENVKTQSSTLLNVLFLIARSTDEFQIIHGR